MQLTAVALESYFEVLSSDDIRIKGHRIGIPTVTRIPRIQGFPPIISGFKVIRFSSCIKKSQLQFKLIIYFKFCAHSPKNDRNNPNKIDISPIPYSNVSDTTPSIANR
jgi:hypothetical protein